MKIIINILHTMVFGMKLSQMPVDIKGTEGNLSQMPVDIKGTEGNLSQMPVDIKGTEESAQ